MFQELSLDDLPAKNILARIKDRKLVAKHYRGKSARKLAMSHRWRQGIYSANGDQSVGVTYERLLDWRDLERRYSAAHDAFIKHSDELWAGLKTLHKEVKSEIWFLAPDGAGQDAWVYTGDGLSFKSVDQLINVCSKDPKKRGYVAPRDVAMKFMAARSREDTLRMRSGLYMTYFHDAVEDRLKPYIEKNFKSGHPRFARYEPILFHISNEDRHHCVRSDERGTLHWQDTNIYMVK